MGHNAPSTDFSPYKVKWTLKFPKGFLSLEGLPIWHFPSSVVLLFKVSVLWVKRSPEAGAPPSAVLSEGQE